MERILYLISLVFQQLKLIAEVQIPRGKVVSCGATALLLFFTVSACQDANLPTREETPIHEEDDDTTGEESERNAEGRVQPYEENPHYLAWGEVPIFPLGPTGYHSWAMISRPGTVDFIEQMDRIAVVMEEIDSQHVVGFMRTLPYDPMNHLHDGPVERVLQPWVQTDDERYDLEQFEPEWEERFTEYLDSALERRIVVAVEIWDDWSVTRGPGGAYDPGEDAAWNAHPFNPENNINYDEDLLPVETDVCNAPFYSTIPSLDNVEPVLALQQRYVDKVLELIAGYPNVIINISNESRAHLEWSQYWTEYIDDHAPDGLMTGEMPSTRGGNGQCDDEFNPLTLSTKPGYAYVDVAQAVSDFGSDDAGDEAIDGGKKLFEYWNAMEEAGTIRPLVVSKEYTRGPDGGDIILWSRFVGGAAAVRFHRLGKDHGPKISDFQHEAVERLGSFIAEVPFWELQPSPDLLEDLPGGTEANVLASGEGDESADIVIQLLGGEDGDDVSLNLEPGSWTVQWVDPSTGEKVEQVEISVDSSPYRLEIPETLDHWIVYLKS